MAGRLHLRKGQTLPKGLRVLARASGYDVPEPRKEDPITLGSQRRTSLALWGAHCPDWCVWLYTHEGRKGTCDLCGKPLVGGG